MPYVALANFASGSVQLESSPDGSMWTGSTHPFTKGGTALAFGNNIFVAMAFALDGVTSIALTSTDGGGSWTSHSVPQPFNEYQGLTYSTSLALFVAIDSGNGTSANVITSPDGVTWTLTATIAQGADTAFYESITSGGTSVLVAVGDDSATHKVVATSPDAVTWTKRLGAGTGKDWNSVVFGGGQYVAVTGVSANHQVMTSPDGITWSLQVTPTPRQFWASVTYGSVGGGLYVAVGVAPSGPQVPQIMTSPDGITWTQRTPPPAVNISLKSVAFFNGLFVAVGFGTGGKNIITSPDGITWTLQTSAIPDNLQATAGAAVSPPPPSTSGGLGFVSSGVAGPTGGSVLGGVMRPCRTTELDWSSFQRILDAVKPDVVEEVDYPGRRRG
jgi:hypothetical protein